MKRANPLMRRPTLVSASLLAALLTACEGGADPNTSPVGGSGGAAGTGGLGGTGGAAGISGAGGDLTGGTGGMDEVDPNGPYMPLATGNTWTFQTTAAGAVEAKTQTVGEWEAVGGTGPNSAKMAFHVVTEKAGGADMTESWQAEVDGLVVRYRERSYMASTGALELEEHWEPHKLRLDTTAAHTTPNAMWIEQYIETKQPIDAAATTATSSDTWRVMAVDESVTVPAGTFQALVIEKTGAGSPKRYWFVRGVGKVKETGAQTEELVSFDLAE